MVTKKVSEFVGQAASAEDNQPTAVFRALKPLWCTKCGGAIAEGVLFTRQMLAKQNLRLVPQCVDCAPFEFRRTTSPASPPATAGRARSALLRSVLQAPHVPSAKVQAEVDNRLGPALARCKRSSKM